MERRTFIVVVVAAALLGGGAVSADQIWDQPGYNPSSDLVLGAWGQEWGDSWGYVIADPFQINLLYQAGMLDSDIDAFRAQLYDTYDTQVGAVLPLDMEMARLASGGIFYLLHPKHRLSKEIKELADSILALE